MAQAKNPIRELRVGFFGSGGSGKTQLVNVLASRRYRTDEGTTIGISNNSFQSESGDVRVTLTTHGEAVKHRQKKEQWVRAEPINVICIDQSDKQSLQEADFYIMEVRKQKPDSQIIIAITKTDESEKQQVTQKDIQQFKEKHKLPDIKVMETSAAKNTGIDDLRDLIVRQKDKQLIDKFKMKVDLASMELKAIGANSQSPAVKAWETFQNEIAAAANECSKSMVQGAIKKFTSQLTEKTLEVEPPKVRDFFTKLIQWFKGQDWNTADEIRENIRYEGQVALKEKLSSYKDDAIEESKNFKP
ncbi:GTPase domain-containing protein [Legionella sp. WA2024007413]